MTIPRSLLFLFLLLFSTVTSALGVDPKARISQYAHSAWRIEDGVLGGSPIVVTQTTDGFLWIGTNLGLIREYEGM